MMRDPAVPILTVGFGILISLIVFTGAGALRRSESVYSDGSRANDRYRHAQRALDDLAKGIYVVGLLARDDLLDRSDLRLEEYRQQFAAERSLIEQSFRQLEEATEGQDLAQHERLRKEVEAYWDAVQPIFDWTATQKAQRGAGFLVKQILPHREAALGIAREFSDLMRESLNTERAGLDRRHADFIRYVRERLGAAVLMGIAIAAVTLWMVIRSARQTRQQYQRTQAAEDELRLLSRKLVGAQEEERKAISRELHDEVGQMLTGLRMELRSVQDLRAAPEPQFVEHVDSAKRLAEQALRCLKDLAMGLRPSMLDDLGLGSAVQWQGRQFSKHSGIPVNVQLSGLDEPVPERHRTCAYRLVQEALTNCGRHAKPTFINVTIRKTPGSLAVSVKDDGVGFDRDSARGRGMGLLGMEERVKELGGDLTIIAQPNAGTTVHATIPLGEAGGNGDSDSAGR